MSKLPYSSSSNPLLLEEQLGDLEFLSILFRWFLGILALGVTAGILISLVHNDTMQAMWVGVGFLPILAAYILVRRKKFETAITLLAVILIALMTLVSTLGLGIHHISVIGYPAILIVASMVARKRTMVLLTVYTIACLGWLVFGELAGLYTPIELEQSVPGDFFSASVIVIITALMVRMITETLFQSNIRYRNELRERQLAEQALAFSEEKFSQAFHTSPVIMSIEGEDHKFIDVNQAFVDGIGYSREEALGRSAAELQLWASEEDVQKVRELVAKQESLDNLELRFRRKSGEVGVALMSSDRFEANGIHYELTSALDITDRKQADEALRDSERRLRGFVENTTDGIILLDGKGKVVEWNPAMERITGLDRRHAIGLPAWEIQMRFSPPEETRFWDVEEIKRDYLRIFESGIVHSKYDRGVETGIQHVDGSQRLAEQRLFLSETGRGYEMSVLFHDITDRKRVELELNRRAEEMSLLYRLGMALAGGENLYLALRAFVRELKHIMTVDAFHIGLYDAETDIFSYSLFLNLGEDIQPPSRSLKDKPGLTWEVLSSRKSLYLEDVADPQILRGHSIVWVKDAPIRAYLGIPLLLQDRVIGIMSVQSIQPAAYSSDQIRLLETIATQVAITIEKLSLLDQVQRELAERKQAEEALKEAETLYRTLVEQTSVVAYRDAPDEIATPIYISPRVEILLGYTPEEWLSEPDFWMHQVHPEDLPRVLADVKRYVTDGTNYVTEYRLKTRAGDWRWIRDETVVVKDEVGKARFIHGVFFDITERKQAETDLQQREIILDAVAVSAEALFKTRDWRHEVDGMLERLGKSIHATHAYLFQNVKREDDRLGTTLAFEWTAPGFESDLGDPRYKAVLLKEDDLASWYQNMSQGLPYIGDKKRLSDNDYQYLLNREMKALLDVPIFIDGFWWGSLGFDDMSLERVWTNAEVDGLVVAVNVLAGAIKRSQMDAALQKSASRLSLLHNIDRALLSAQSLDQITNETLSRIRQLIPSQSLSISLFELEKNEVRLAARRFADDYMYQPIDRPAATLDEYGRHILDELMQDRPCRVDDSLAEPNSTALDLALAEKGFRSWLYLPLFSQGRLFGALSLGRVGVLPFTDEEESIGYEIGNQLAIVLQQNKLLEALQAELTERKRMQDVLYEEKERAEVTLHSIGDAVITTSIDARVEYLNPVAEHLTGWKVKDAVGQPLENVFKVINEDSRLPVVDPVTRCLREGRVIELANHSILIRRDGMEFSIDDSAAPIRNRKAEIIGAVLVFHDITEERRLTRQVAHDAMHDGLTGLINRREFEKRLGRALNGAKERNLSHVLCYLDLDQFKIVNDTAGHVAGDELLRQLARLLSGLFRQRDTFARLGGDEFGLLLENCALDQAQVICNEILAKTHDFSFAWEGNNFQVSVSIGITPITAEKESANQLLSQADIACYSAKDLGRNRFNVYQSDDSETVQRHSEIVQAARMKDAVTNDQFILYCQPIAELADYDAAFSKYEVLLRMQNDEQKLSLPSAFIPSAERYGLMPAIDRWVIRRTFSAISKSQLLGVQVTINLSGNSLDDETLLEYVLEQLHEFSIPPSQICFEITETAAIHHISKARLFTQAFRERGGKIALDDFGSGFSSFRYLKTLPVDYIKIDGDFVREMLSNPNDQAMVEAITQVAHTLGIYVIAEHATNLETVNRLRELGVEGAQGFGIGHPVPVEDAWKKK